MIPMEHCAFLTVFLELEKSPLLLQFFVCFSKFSCDASKPNLNSSVVLVLTSLGPFEGLPWHGFELCSKFFMLSLRLLKLLITFSLSCCKVHFQIINSYSSRTRRI